MNYLLLAAAGIILATAFAHSYLGEKYILRRLFRRELPKLFGSDWFTKRTLRFAWHLTSLAWVALAFILGEMSHHSGDEMVEIVALTVIGLCVASGIVAFAFTRGRHLAWVAFLAVAVLVWLA